MEADFARSLKLVLTDEGGLSDDPHDHGGRTAHGIIQREYDAYRRRKGLPVQDVWRITPAEVSEIYHTCYWEPWCQQLPAGLDYIHFDDRVNAGVIQAVKNLQRALGVRVDGHMGEITLDALAHVDDLVLIKRYADERRKFYRRLKQYSRYGRGWLARVDHVEHAAEELASTGETTRVALPDNLRKQATARVNSQDLKNPRAAKNSVTHAVAAVISAVMTFILQGAVQPHPAAPAVPATIVAPTVVGWPPPFPKHVKRHVVSKQVVPWKQNTPAP